MRNAKIQTNLLGRTVRFLTPEDANMTEADFHQCMRHADLAGRTGPISNVFLDKEGSPMYTVNINGNLRDVYAAAFTVIEP